MVNGELLLENHRFTKVDADEIYAKAAEIAGKLWKTVDKIQPYDL